MRDAINKLRKNNIKFYTNLILELGLLRKRNECAICFKLINIQNYNIQLCKECRKTLINRQTEDLK